MLLLKLFFAFMQVGLFSVGGGYAAIPLIQEQIVNIHKLMTMEEFTDLITVAEMTPGPISINSATFVGMRIAGIPGVLICTIGCIIPSFCICLTLAHFLLQIPHRERCSGGAWLVETGSCGTDRLGGGIHPDAWPVSGGIGRYHTARCPCC